MSLQIAAAMDQQGRLADPFTRSGFSVRDTSKMILELVEQTITCSVAPPALVSGRSRSGARAAQKALDHAVLKPVLHLWLHLVR